MAHTNVDKVNMLLIYGQSNKNSTEAKRMYQLQFPNRPQPDRKTFSNLCNNLKDYGSFKNQNVKEYEQQEPRRIRL